MPPQRRKIVPPITTKAHRTRVAASAKSEESDAPDAAPEVVAAPVAEKNDAPVTEKTAEKAPEPAGDKEVPAAADTIVPTVTQSAPTVKMGKSAPVASADTEADAKVDTSKPKVNKSTRPMKPSAAYLRPRTAGEGTDVAEDTTPSGRSMLGWKYVAIVGAVAVILAVIAVVAAFKPGAQLDNTAWVDESGTSQVTAAASNAVQTLYSYKFDTIDQDFNNARAVLNSSMLDEFNKTADTTKSAVLQTKAATEAKVTDIGVTLLQDDRAELLINMNVSATTDGVAQGSAQGPLNVNMTRIDGKWLLSGIDDN